jgi:hypothetical protein
MAFVSNRTRCSRVLYGDRTIQGTVAVNKLYRVQHLLVKEPYRVWYLLVRAIHSSHTQQLLINISSLFFNLLHAAALMWYLCYLPTITSSIKLNDGNIEMKNKMDS